MKKKILLIVALFALGAHEAQAVTKGTIHYLLNRLQEPQDAAKRTELREKLRTAFQRLVQKPGKLSAEELQRLGNIVTPALAEEAPPAEPEPVPAKEWHKLVGMGVQFRIGEEEGSKTVIFADENGENEISLWAAARGNMSPELLNILNLNLQTDTDIADLSRAIVEQLKEKIPGENEQRIHISPRATELIEIVKKLKDTSNPQLHQFAAFVRHFIDNLHTSQLGEGLVSVLSNRLQQVLKPAEPIEEEKEAEPAAEAEGEGEEEELEPAVPIQEPAALAFEVSGDNVLSVSVRGLKHNTADEDRLRELVVALARVSDDDVRKLGADITNSQSDTATHDMLIKDNHLFDAIDKIKDALPDAQKQKLRTFIDAIVAAIQDKTTRDGVQAMAPQL